MPRRLRHEDRGPPARVQHLPGRFGGRAARRHRRRPQGPGRHHRQHPLTGPAGQDHPAQDSLDNESCTSDLPEEQCDDAFVSQRANGRSLVFSTYLGGQAGDQGLAVTVDTSGNVYVAGRTDSRDFPVLRAAQPEFGGYIDGFAAKLANRTGALLWSTFVGGDEADRATGIDPHRDGGVHLTGRTLSPDFPSVNPFQPAMAKDDDYDAYLQVLR